jgi:myosin heavy subunit
MVAELDASRQDVDRMVEMIKAKEQEHATEFEKVRQKNSELTEMLDETIDKLDSTEKQLNQQTARVTELEVSARRHFLNNRG